MSQIRRRQFLIATGALVVAPLAHSQQAPKITIGFLSANARAAMAARAAAFEAGLRDLGYAEGKNIRVEYRYVEATPETVLALAAELVRMNVSVIVTEGTTATRSAKQATSSIPIVMAQDPDPVGTGFVASLARPGGNITGLSNFAPELSAKRLELLKEAVPGLASVVILGTLNTPGVARQLRETEVAANALKLRVQFHDITKPQDIDSAFGAATVKRDGALLTLSSPILLTHRTKVVDLAAKSRLPAIYHVSDFTDAGGMMSYGVAIAELFRRAATYVDKILKGAKPADLPVEQPTKLNLVINLKTAKAIGITIPKAVLFRADSVIE